jgi:hypothetical protein
MRELEEHDTPAASAGGLGRLSLLLLFSTLGIAAFWRVLYGVGLITAIAVAGEVAAILTLAFICAWRWSR